MAVLLITPDLGVVAETADRVVVMYCGRVVEQAKVLDLFTAPKHPVSLIHILLPEKRCWMCRELGSISMRSMGRDSFCASAKCPPYKDISLRENYTISALFPVQFGNKCTNMQGFLNFTCILLKLPTPTWCAEP